MLKYAGSIKIVQTAYDKGLINEEDILKIADIWSKDKRVRMSEKLINEELRKYPGKRAKDPKNNVLDGSVANMKDSIEENPFYCSFEKGC